MALYQAIYPDTYMGTCQADTPTYTINVGDDLNADSREFVIPLLKLGFLLCQSIDTIPFERGG
jgi:hypothetical protein